GKAPPPAARKNRDLCIRGAAQIPATAHPAKPYTNPAESGPAPADRRGSPRKSSIAKPARSHASTYKRRIAPVNVSPRREPHGWASGFGNGDFGARVAWVPRRAKLRNRAWYRRAFPQHHRQSGRRAADHRRRQHHTTDESLRENQAGR